MVHESLGLVGFRRWVRAIGSISVLSSPSAARLCDLKELGLNRAGRKNFAEQSLQVFGKLLFLKLKVHFTF